MALNQDYSKIVGAGTGGLLPLLSSDCSRHGTGCFCPWRQFFFVPAACPYTGYRFGFVQAGWSKTPRGRDKGQYPENLSFPAKYLGIRDFGCQGNEAASCRQYQDPLLFLA